MADHASPQRLHTYSALCIARCGAIAVVMAALRVKSPIPAAPPAGRSAPKAVPARNSSTIRNG